MYIASFYNCVWYNIRNPIVDWNETAKYNETADVFIINIQW